MDTHADDQGKLKEPQPTPEELKEKIYRAVKRCELAKAHMTVRAMIMNKSKDKKK